MKLLQRAWVIPLICTAVNATQWDSSPPVSPGAQSFWFGASDDAYPEWEEVTVTLYKNGVYLASQTDTGHAWVTTSTTAGLHTSIGANELSMIVNPDTQTPSIPAGLNASNLTSTAFSLAWITSSDNGGVVGYEVKRDAMSLGMEAGASRNITELSPLVTYQFSVRAKDIGDNWSNWSTPLSVTLPDTTAPTSPSGLSLLGYTSATVSISWSGATDNVGVVDYAIYRTASGVTTLVGITAASVLDFIDPYVSPSTNYSYHVTARDAAGNASTPSTSVYLTTSAIADQDGDGIPDELETTFNIQGNPAPPQAEDLNLKPHRPQ